MRSMSWGSVHDYGGQHGLLELRVLRRGAVHFRGMQHLCEYRLHVMSWGSVHDHCGQHGLLGLPGGAVHCNDGQHGLLRLRVVRRGAVHFLGMHHV